MDLDLLNTFIEVSKTRHFGKAADNLFITQSAVSARIRLLESNLNTHLFDRSTKHVNLTDQGKKLLQHAEVILLSWDNAKLDLITAEEAKQQLSVATTAGLWYYVFNQKVVDILHQEDYLINALSLADEEIRRLTVEGALDLALVYDSINDANISYQQIGAMKLRLMAHKDIASDFDPTTTPYIHINWGHSFNLFHQKQFNASMNLVLQTDNAQTAQQAVLSQAGCAYLPDILLEDDDSLVCIDAKLAPAFKRKVYACYTSASERKNAIQKIIKQLKF